MKRNYWPVLFIGIFTFTFLMIVWTIYSAVQTPVYQDETFLKSYHDVDDNYNNIIHSNIKFSNKYEFLIDINKNIFPLVTSDIFLSQRVIEKNSTHKNIFIKGKNYISVVIKDKDKNILNTVKIKLRVTRPTNHNNTIDLTNKEFIFKNNKYSSTIELPLKGNWNITGTFEIDKDIGYFYLKSNAN